jgi:hypothetical protein
MPACSCKVRVAPCEERQREDGRSDNHSTKCPPALRPAGPLARAERPPPLQLMHAQRLNCRCLHCDSRLRCCVAEVRASVCGTLPSSHSLYTASCMAQKVEYTARAQPVGVEAECACGFQRNPSNRSTTHAAPTRAPPQPSQPQPSHTHSHTHGLQAPGMDDDAADDLDILAFLNQRRNPVISTQPGEQVTSSCNGRMGGAEPCLTTWQCVDSLRVNGRRADRTECPERPTSQGSGAVWRVRLA